MPHRIVLLLIAAVLSLTVQPAVAQDGGTCPDIVSAALQAVDAACAGLGRDQACYGHTRVEAAFRQPRDPADFDAPADRVPLAEVQSLATAALDPTSETWGIAVASLRANLPDTMPGQAVTFLLMGDAALENAIPPDGSPPMQAFTFTTGLSEPACSEAPNALLVQSPGGATVALRINDLDVQIGSTVAFSLASANGQPVLVIALLDGHLQANVNGTPIELQPGGLQTVAVTLNGAGRVDAASLVVSVPDSAAEVQIEVALEIVAQVAFLEPIPPTHPERVVLVGPCRPGEVMRGPAGRVYHILGSDGPHFAENLNDLSFGVTLDGQALPPVTGNFLRPGEDGSLHIQQVFDAGVLDAGTYHVVNSGSMLRQITDPLGQTWGPETWSQACRLIVGGR